jgi:hypothetical protein
MATWKSHWLWSVAAGLLAGPRSPGLVWMMQPFAGLSAVDFCSQSADFMRFRPRLPGWLRCCGTGNC